MRRLNSNGIFIALIDVGLKKDTNTHPTDNRVVNAIPSAVSEGHEMKFGSSSQSTQYF